MRCPRPNDMWQRMWDVHVMAHVYACRAALPGMLERGEGYLVNVASAAGLLSQIGDTAYSATKHAAVGLAESLAITYGERGVRVSVVCPQYVATAITGLDEDARGRFDARACSRSNRRPRAIVDGIEARAVPDPDAPRGARFLPAQGVGLRPLARGHASPARRTARSGRVPEGRGSDRSAERVRSGADSATGRTMQDHEAIAR